MSPETWTRLLDLAGGGLLLTAVLVLWRREPAATVRVLAAQGLLLALLVALIGARAREGQVIGTAVLLAALRGVALPAVMRRFPALRVGRAADGRQAGALVEVDASLPAAAVRVPAPRAADGRQAGALVEVDASLPAAAVLVLLGYAAARPLTDLDPGPAGRALPAGLALVLIGFFALTTRRRALSQVGALLMLDNGITATAFLAAGGLPLIVELGASFDLLLVVVVLRLLGSRLRAAFGDTDLDDLRELHD